MFYVLPLGPESDDLEDAATRIPAVTYGFLAVLLGVYVTGLPLAPDAFLDRFFRWGFLPGRLAGPPALTYLFFHENFWRTLTSLIFLASFGITVERRLGHLAALLAFLSGGFAGAVAYELYAVPVKVMAGGAPVIFMPPLFGLSPALMGLVGCLLPVLFTLRIRVAIGWLRTTRVVPVSAWKVVSVYLLQEAYSVTKALGEVTDGRAHYSLAAGLLTGLCLGALVAAVSRMAAPGPLKAAVQAGRESSVMKIPRPKPPPVRPPAPAAPGPVSRSDANPEAPAPARIPGIPEPPAAPAPIPSDSIEVSLSSAEGLAPADSEPVDDLSDATRADFEELDSGYVALLGEADIEELPEAIGPVPVEHDMSQVSGEWAGSIEFADLQERILRARGLEKDPDRAGVAFKFYKKLLKDRDLPAGYRTYAGARAARMLLRTRKYEKAWKLAARLLESELPDEIRGHIQETYKTAVAGLARRAARAKARATTESETSS